MGIENVELLTEPVVPSEKDVTHFPEDDDPQSLVGDEVEDDGE